ncbi:hypothetical protein [Tissierella praeacuta]|uniref:hypothetical protein n=1 Tax=Tissierella praeacuta TaxID=43131 RepID=UPI0033413E50
MSRFYHIVTKEELPFKVIAQSRIMRFLLEENVNYIYDAKPGYRYYNCTPWVLSNTSKLEKYKEDLPLCENFGEHEYFMWLIKEFKKLGNFKFIVVWEDNSKCATGYYEKFFKTCEKEYISFDKFSKYFQSEKNFNNFEFTKEDVLFIVNVK